MATKKSLLQLWLLAACLLSWASVGAGQCECVSAYPPLWYERADFVFAGLVQRVEKEKGVTKYEVQIEDTFRGQEKKPTVTFHDASDSCNLLLKTGERYPLMARKDSATGKYWLLGCSYSSLTPGREKVFIEYFRWRKNSGSQGGIVLGTVIRTPGRKPQGIDKVFLKSESSRVYETQIEADGFYKFTDLPAGFYKVFLKLPDSLIAASGNGDYLDMDEPAPHFELGAKGDSAAVFRYFGVYINGAISGRVFDSEGVPVADIKVTLYRLAETQDPEEKNTAIRKDYEQEYWEKTDFFGNYGFKGLPPGRYRIKAGDEDRFLNYNSPDTAYLTGYFPAAKTEKEAEVITLGKAQVLANTHITSLPKLKKRIITGRIVWPDGRPAPEAEISFIAKRSGKLDSGWYSNGRDDTDGQGNISFEAYEDTEYLVMAGIDKPINDVVVEVTHSSQCVVIPANGAVSPITLVLKPGDKNCKER